MYLDSAYIAKFYLNEPDSPRVRAALAGASALVSSIWALAEVTCAFHRHLREGSISTSQYRALANAFLQHVDGHLWTLVPVTERLLRRMTALMTTLPPAVHLRSGDALHLATAMDLGEREIWTSDRHVLSGAPYFGLTGRTA
ncbi:MAG TPA: type II toxin-antitoxin system VapC family toxin [Bryobacteraceae bacterium]|nr:type II toxin-antitoxin system VapC family toxin [Bryobacteraceae bacterium]